MANNWNDEAQDALSGTGWADAAQGAITPSYSEGADSWLGAANEAIGDTGWLDSGRSDISPLGQALNALQLNIGHTGSEYQRAATALISGYGAAGSPSASNLSGYSPMTAGAGLGAGTAGGGVGGMAGTGTSGNTSSTGRKEIVPGTGGDSSLAQWLTLGSQMGLFGSKNKQVPGSTQQAAAGLLGLSPAQLQFGSPESAFGGLGGQQGAGLLSGLMSGTSGAGTPQSAEMTSLTGAGGPSGQSNPLFQSPLQYARNLAGGQGPIQTGRTGLGTGVFGQEAATGALPQGAAQTAATGPQISPEGMPQPIPGINPAIQDIMGAQGGLGASGGQIGAQAAQPGGIPAGPMGTARQAIDQPVGQEEKPDDLQFGAPKAAAKKTKVWVDPMASEPEQDQLKDLQASIDTGRQAIEEWKDPMKLPTFTGALMEPAPTEPGIIGKSGAALIEGGMAGAEKGLRGMAQAIQPGLRQTIGASLPGDQSGVGQALRMTPEEFTKANQRAIAERNKQLAERHPGQTGSVAIGKVLGEIAPALAVPGGAFARIGTRLLGSAGKLAGGAATGAAVGAMQLVPEGGSRLSNTLIGAALGTGASAVGSILGKVPGLKSARKLAKKVKQADITPKATAKSQLAAKRLGTTLTPGEATQAPLLRGAEGRLTPSKKGILEATKATAKRADTLKTKMKDTVQSVLPKGTTSKQVKAMTQKMYEDISKQPMSKSANKQLLMDPAIAKFSKDALNPRLSNASRYPAGSAGRMIETEKYIKSLPDQNQVTKEAAKRIQKALDSEFSRYGDARKLAQKGIVYRKLMDDYEKIGLKAGEEVPVADQLYNKFFGSLAKQKDFLRNIGQAGGNTQQAKDLIRVISKVKGSTFEKILQRDSRVVTPHAADQGLIGMTTSAARKLFMFRHDNKIVKLITNPKYSDEISKLAKLDPTKEKFKTGLNSLLAKAGASLTGEDSKAPAGAKPKGMPEPTAQFKDPLDSVTTPKAQLPKSDLTKMQQSVDTTKDKELINKLMDMPLSKLKKEILSSPGSTQKFLDWVKKNGGDVAKVQKALEKIKGSSLSLKKPGSALDAAMSRLSEMLPKEKAKLGVTSKDDSRAAALKKKAKGKPEKYLTVGERRFLEMYKDNMAKAKERALKRQLQRRKSRLLSGKGSKKSNKLRQAIIQLLIAYLSKNPRITQNMAKLGLNPTQVINSLR